MFDVFGNEDVAVKEFVGTVDRWSSEHVVLKTTSRGKELEKVR